MTDAEVLQEVERLIETTRWARGTGEPAERAYDALKIVARDLRARCPGAASTALRLLQDRIEATERSRMMVGYDPGALRALAMDLLARWPTVRAALSSFNEGGENDDGGRRGGEVRAPEAARGPRGSHA